MLKNQDEIVSAFESVARVYSGFDLWTHESATLFLALATALEIKPPEIPEIPPTITVLPQDRHDDYLGPA